MAGPTIAWYGTQMHAEINSGWGTAGVVARNAQLFIEGEWLDGESVEVLTSKFDGAPVAQVQVASRAQVDAAILGVAKGQETIEWPPFARFQVLQRASQIVNERADTFAEAVALDTGFVAADARLEVERCVQTLMISGEEAKRIAGEMVPLASGPAGGERLAFTVRHPRGVVCAITPFNSPLNTVAHKIGPALAAGNGVVLKPSAYTPLSADLLVQALLDAGLPPALIALLQGPGATVGDWLLQHPVPAFYAFTGSTSVGLHIRQTVGLRPAQLELGSLSSTIVCDDANLDACVPKVVSASFRKAGQVCTSIQRLYVQSGVLEELVAEVEGALRGRHAGDPSDPGSFIGPVISNKDAERIKGSIDEALSNGGQLALGGARDRALVQPTLLTGVTPDMSVMNREIFGPVVSIRVFDEYEQALAEVNETPFGLAAGIFTNNLDQAMLGARRLRMGSVHVNETSSSRVDLMPFGGVKQSGSGKEGPRYAIKEMTEERLVTFGPHG